MTTTTKTPKKSKTTPIWYKDVSGEYEYYTGDSGGMCSCCGARYTPKNEFDKEDSKGISLIPTEFPVENLFDNEDECLTNVVTKNGTFALYIRKTWDESWEE